MLVHETPQKTYPTNHMKTFPEWKKTVRAAVVAAVVAGGSQLGFAATRTWDGDTSVNLNDAANWNTLPVSGSDILSFGATSPSGTTLNNDFASGFVVNGLDFVANALAYTINGNDIVLNGNITMSATGVTNKVINLNMDLGSADRTINTRNNGNITLGGILSGTGGIIKANLGNLILSGTNTYSGNTTINSGVLFASFVNTNLGTGSTINMGSGTATASLWVDGAGNETVTKTINLAGTTGGATLRNNKTGSDTLTFSSDFTATGAGAKILTLDASANGNLGVISGAIGDSSGGATSLVINKGTWTLSGNNSYTGGTTVSGGVAKTSHANAFGTGNVTFSGGQWNAGSSVAIANNIALDSNTQGNALSQTTDFTGVFTGTGNFSVNGFLAGTVRLSGNNSGWTGNWKFNGANKLQLNHVNAIGSGTTITFNNATTDNTIRGNLESLVDVNLSQNIHLGDAVASVSNNAVITTTANMTVSGNITGADDADLVKNGNATLTLASGTVNSYLGTTTVSAGTMLVHGNNSAATGLVTVSSTGTFGGNGTIGGSLTLDSGAKFVFSLTDTLTVNGTNVTFGGFGVDDLVGLDSSVALGTYVLIDGAATIDTTNLANLGIGNAFDIGGGKSAYFQIGSLELVVIPEPATWGLLAAGLTVTMVLRRRRNA